MVSTNDMRPGQSIIVDNVLYQILEYPHFKPGKGKTFVKNKPFHNVLKRSGLQRDVKSDLKFVIQII